MGTKKNRFKFHAFFVSTLGNAKFVDTPHQGVQIDELLAVVDGVGEEGEEAEQRASLTSEGQKGPGRREKWTESTAL